MERVRRFNVVIIAAIACAVLLCSAAFSVSFAAWGSKVSPTVSAEGSIGSFYVEYPQYGGTASLDPDTYYVQVKKTDDAEQIAGYAYYPMSKGVAASGGEEHSVALNLDQGKSVCFYKGETQITEIDKNWSWENGGTLENGVYTASPINSGCYSFYLKIDSPYSLYVGYSPTETTDSPDPIETLNDVATVRQVNGKTVYNENKGGYVYHNYICVSRQNNVGDYDNSICFLEFEVTGSEEDLNKTVNSIVITRADTDANGVPKTDADGNPQYVNPAPRLYNYDPTGEIKLGDIDHGAMLDVEGGGDVQYPGIMVNHYDKGMYCLLFFADGNQQYFALDIEIVTAETASFTLTAKASNVNHWQRFKSGYGEPWGFYLGGLVNNVWLWDPRRTTKMNVSSGTVDPNNENTFKTVHFDDERGDVQYPGVVIDMTLTVNLTGGSRVKMYMVDNEGHRLKGNTVYLIPNEVICDPVTMSNGIDMYDKDLNFRIPVSGSYTFRLVGNVYKREETPSNGKGGRYIKLSDGSRSSVGGDGYVSIPDYNLIVDKLYITNSEGKGTCDITFDANGGTFDGADTLKQAIMFGSNLSEPIAPTHSDGSKMFGGWYTDRACTEAFDFNSPVTDNITLYAKWVGKQYTIVFNPGEGGAMKDGASDTQQTDISGSCQLVSIPEAVRAGATFLGWYTEENGGGVKVTTDTVFSGNNMEINVYAHWGVQKYAVTFNMNGMPNVTAPTSQQVDYGGKVIDPTAAIALPEHYNIEGWYTTAACTAEYDFGTAVTSDMTLYVKWYADAGIYANDVYKIELADDGGSYKYKAENVELQADDKLTFWGYDATKNVPYQITDNAFIRNSGTTGISPAFGDIIGADYKSIKVEKSDVYSLYINDNAWQDETGIWATYGGVLQSTDGLYSDSTQIAAFVESSTGIVRAENVEITADDTTLILKFGGYVRQANIDGTKKDIILGEGKYNFEYNYKDNILVITSVVSDPNAAFTYEAVSNSAGYLVGKFSNLGHTDFGSDQWNSGYKQGETDGSNYYSWDRIYLCQNDVVKIRIGTSNNFGYSDIRHLWGTTEANYGGTIADSDNNIVVRNSGYYKIEFWMSYGNGDGTFSIISITKYDS